MIIYQSDINMTCICTHLWYKCMQPYTAGTLRPYTIHFYFQFKFTDGDPRGRSLADFGWEKSPFSRKFKNAHAPKEFMAIWDEHVATKLNVNTGAYDESKATAPVESTELDLPKPKRAKEDTEENMDKKIDAAYSGIQNM